MEILICLSIITIVFFIVNIYICKFDMWSPSSLFYIFWIISIFSTIYLLDIYKLKINLLFGLIVIVGLFSFFLGANCIKSVRINRQVETLNNDFLEIRNKYFVNIFIIVLISILGYVAISYNFSQLGLVAINEISESSEAMNNYRLAYLDGEIESPFYIRQINRFLVIMAYFSVFDLARKIIFKKNIINIYINILIILISFINIILQASRTQIVYILIAFFIYINVFYIRKNRKVISVKRNIIIFIMGIVLLLFFGLMGVMMERPGQEEPFMVVCRYFATGIMGLNYASGTEQFYPSVLFGEATFGGIWRCINDYIVNINYDYYQDFNFYNGYSLGNTYTGLYKYYSDFGFWGISILPFILGWIFSNFYNKIINKNVNFIEILLFGYFVKGIVLFSYDELMISTQISFGLISDIIYIFFIKTCFFKEKYNK